MSNKFKKIASQVALKYIKNNNIIGIGTGTTIKYFINMLYKIKNKVDGFVSTSITSTNELKKYNFHIYNSNEVDLIDIYFDSADEINNNMEMIKGGGAALTNEKIIANISNTFICIIDQSKHVNILGKIHPLPIEVIPTAKSYVFKELSKLGGLPKLRKGIITEHGNIILDIYNLNIIEPIKLEKYINSIAGVVTVGLFANRCADIVITGNYDYTVSIKKNTKLLSNN
ncbi:ribose-5-phosphate isomerase RpiA [Enterobacteriaceae endosymbiont of Plateumaris consimilis]|uniref:ribose-5-phosphate isomerase RpiA n=1 Tax=Enterobacteriaceae endosymbiont of Plateumaris consimilis TaxID=2675794 RepID=UPI00144A0BAC|nr:ribose-5-phosphate isomerase RpiA [Enterobacteriaceae endosymbiont of Plateumaris consimilis]QJC28612.1 ribose-5-phosphate isomerase RpiA [Enterobacteriaceae endosymbiont of Plateumaris consimilis]